MIMLNILTIVSLLAILLAGILAVRKKPVWKKWLALSVVFVLLVAGIANVNPTEQATSNTWSTKPTS
jgi:hypothetical protein